MSNPSAAHEIDEANAAFADGFPHAGLAKEPARRVAVVTCMDCRLDVYAMLGLAPGDAHIIRNAGAVLTDDVMRSLVLSQRALGTREILYIGHTQCGVQGLDDEAFADDLESATGVRPPWPVGGFDEVRAAVASSVATLVQSPWLPHTDAVAGYVYDVDSGRLEPVTS